MQILRPSFLIFLIMATPVWADIFKYTDENGQVTFTDEYKEGGKRIELPPEPELFYRRKATNAEARRCFEKHRINFLDPRSAYLVKAAVVELRMPPNDKGQTKLSTFVEIDVSARNGGGGAARVNKYCPIK